MISTKTFCLGLLCSCVITLAQANLGDIDEGDLDNPLIVEGKELLQNEDWTAAITRFESALDTTPNSADLHNFLGYAYRKSGDLDKAFLHYDKALAINPDHKAAIEYLGEAYIAKGDLTNATVQLQKLKRLCSPIPCEELRELEQALERASK
jgi:Flp pilus assembly protein TadD